jgi:hypothetical protein
MGCGNAKMIAIDQQIQHCLDTLGKRPDLKNYKGELVSQKNIEAAYANTVFGSSIY